MAFPKKALDYIQRISFVLLQRYAKCRINVFEQMLVSEMSVLSEVEVRK
jgi:hypothetical protein